MTTIEFEGLLCKLMSSVVLFRNIDRDALLALLRAASKATFKPGALVFEEGLFGDAMFVVIHGKFEVFKRMDDGEAHIAFVFPGEHFGEVALVTNRPRMASVRAMEDSVALRLTKEALFEQPMIALYLLKNMASLMAEHLSVMNNEVLLLDVSRRQHAIDLTTPASPDHWISEQNTDQEPIRLRSVSRKTR